MSRTTDPSLRSELDKLKEVARLQLSKAKAPRSIEAAGRILAQAVEIEQKLTETEKLRSEQEKISQDARRSRSEERKYLISQLAPLLTAAVLARDSHSTDMANNGRTAEQARCR